MDPQLLMMLLNQGKSGLSGIFQGLSGNAGEPYQAAEKELNDFYNRSRNVQNPFYNMGTNAIPQLQDWLSGQKDPSAFINNLMGKYQESPWAHYQQQQAIRGAQNLGSANGLTGSTPLTQFAEENARNISSQDMNTWLQNVLGINTNYGQGLERMLSGGQNAANALTDVNKEFGTDIATMQYNKNKAEQDQKSSFWGGLFNLI